MREEEQRGVKEEMKGKDKEKWKYQLLHTTQAITFNSIPNENEAAKPNRTSIRRWREDERNP